MSNNEDLLVDSPIETTRKPKPVNRSLLVPITTINTTDIISSPSPLLTPPPSVKHRYKSQAYKTLLICANNSPNSSETCMIFKWDHETNQYLQPVQSDSNQQKLPNLSSEDQ